MNRELMEKIASRKWKKNLHLLDESDEQRLRKADILNHNREAEGLNKGSINIAKKYGIKLNMDGNHSKEDLRDIALSREFYNPHTSHLRRMMDKNVLVNDMSLYRKKYPNASMADIRREVRSPGHTRTRLELVLKNNGDEMTTDYLKRYKKLIENPSQKERAYDSLSNVIVWGKDRKPRAIVNAAPDARKRMKDAGVKVSGGIKIWENPDLAKQQHALDLRHEIDEARTRLKQYKNNNIRATRSSYDWSHAAPSVIYRESVNASVLDPRIIKHMRKDRSKLGMSGHTPFGYVMHNHGEKYGEKGVLNKKTLKSYDVSWYSNRPRVNNFDVRGRVPHYSVRPFKRPER